MSIKGTLDISLDKKHKILQAAKARFLHYGVSKTTTRDIAEDLGISVSNLYLYFENKREIILAIAEECRAEQDKTDQEILNDTSLVPSRKLERLLVKKFRQVQDFRTESPKGTELMAYLVQEYPERLVSWQNNLEKLIFSVLEEGVAAGNFLISDVPHNAHMLRIALSQFFLPAHIQLPIEPSEEELVAFVHWHLSLISPSSQ
jgi:AcrR family transcriptional regulator